MSLGFPEIPESAEFSALTVGADQLMKALLEKAPTETRSLLESQEEIWFCGYGLGSLVIKKLLLGWNERQNSALGKVRGVLLLEPPQSKEDLVSWGESLGINLSLPECDSLLQAYSQLPLDQKTISLHRPHKSQENSTENKMRLSPESYLELVEFHVQEMPKKDLQQLKESFVHQLSQVQNESESLKIARQQEEEKQLQQKRQQEKQIQQQEERIRQLEEQIQQQEEFAQQSKSQEISQKKQWEDTSLELQQQKQTLQQEIQQLTKQIMRQIQQSQQQNETDQETIKNFKKMQEEWEQKNQVREALSRENEQLKQEKTQLQQETDRMIQEEKANQIKISNETGSKKDQELRVAQQEINRLRLEIERLEKLKDTGTDTPISDEIKWPANEVMNSVPPKDIPEANQLFLEAKSALNATQTPFGVFVGTGQVSEAKEKFHRILDQYPNSTKAETTAYDLATLYTQGNPKSDGALGLYKKCLSLNLNTSFDVRVRIAMIYEAQEKTQEARFWYQEAILKSQNNEERLIAQQRIQQLK
ncbi:MAG: hypothetical protein AABZ60_18230 [Planctomycetota bacterium]